MAAITEKLEFVNILVNIQDDLLLKLSRPIFSGSEINIKPVLK